MGMAWLKFVLYVWLQDLETWSANGLQTGLAVNDDSGDDADEVTETKLAASASISETVSS